MMNPISDFAFDLLINKLQTFHAINAHYISLLRPMMMEVFYTKGVRILNFHQRQDFIWFVVSGLVREIFVNDNTLKEKTTWFWGPGSFIYTTPGFFSQEPSENTVEVLQDCHLACLSHENLQQLRTKLTEAEKITEMIRSQDVKQRLIHKDHLNSMTTDEVYLENRALLDGLFCLTKRKFIAEFMGMSTDRLGKLRAKH
jgi:CRP-like cAMP-binding protein